MSILRTTARRQLALAVLMTVMVIVAGSSLPWLIPLAGQGLIESGLEHVHAAILFGAASLGLLSGRWAARTSVGFACAALLVLAFAGAVTGTAGGQGGFAPMLATGGAALAVLLLFAAAAAPEVTDAASLQRLLTRESGPIALLGLVGLTPVVDALLVAGMTLSLPGRAVLSAVVAAVWLVFGSQMLKLDRPRLGWLPAVLMILAVEAVGRALVGVWPGSLLIALGLNVLAGSFALMGAAMAARAALVRSNDGMTSMLQDLSTMRDEDSRRRAEDSERLHEVRSVLAGLYAARATLRKYEDSLDPDDRQRLQDAVGEELSRLNHLIDPAPPQPTQALNLEAVVMSTVLAEREQGLVVTTDLADVSVRGRAAEIATLVSDLLVNARMHAPGSAVRLTARYDGGMVALEVRDWGPGLPLVEAERVFERAFRGTRPIARGIPGSGLGLYTARKLARQMQGDLRVRTPEGGGCRFVVTLPAADPVDRQAPALAVDQTPAPGGGEAPALAVDQRHEPIRVHPVQYVAAQHHPAPKQQQQPRKPERVGKSLADKSLAGKSSAGKGLRPRPRHGPPR